MISVTTKDPKKLFAYMRSLSKRVKSVVNTLPNDMCEDVLYGIQSTAKEIEDYPQFLSVKRVEMAGMEVAGVLPPKWAMGYRLKTSDAKVAAIYVIARRRGKHPVSPAAVVLQLHNPWTMKTLPYEPTAQEGEMVVRMVSEREIKSVEKARGDELRSVKSELSKLGVRARPVGKIGVETSVSRDMAFEVLRNEFGMVKGGVPSWRPSIRAARRSAMSRFAMRAVWVTDPSNMRYSGHAATSSGAESASTAKRVQRFQDLVVR